VFYAIDFGTTNTVITRWNAAISEAQTVKLSGVSQQLAHNPPLIPSLVYVTDALKEQIVIGQAVRDGGLDTKNNPRFFRSFKRGIGAEVQGFLPLLDDCPMSFEKVGTWFLNSLVTRLRSQTNDKIDSLILTVPVDTFEVYRHWLTDVCQGWDIEQIRLLDEPTAAALGYGTTGESLLLVVDFGGGTIDLSLVRLNTDSEAKNGGFLLKWGEKLLGNSNKQKSKLAKVIAKAGAQIGGSDLDDWILDYFSRTQDLPKTSLTSRLAERLKIKLSEADKAQEVYFNDETFDSYELALSRGELQEIFTQNNLFSRLDELMSQVLQQSRRNGIEKDDIEGVLLVGGTSQIPAVQDWVKQYFDEGKVKLDRPFTAIALGALQLAQGYEVRDFLYHSYGVRYWNRRTNSHSWHPIINAGQPYPTSKPVELVLGASLEGQPSIELIIGELGAETGATEVYFDGDRLVTRSLGDDKGRVQPLNDRPGSRNIATLDPPGYPGSDRIKVLFSIDDRCCLRITVEDLLTQKLLVSDQIVTGLS
jgi:molecular chaperone DnaK (HSP70)